MIAERLGFRPGTVEWRYVEELDQFEEAGGLSEAPPIEPIGRDAARDLLDRLGVPEEDAADVVASLPTPRSSPEWWWCTERAAARLVSTMGDADAPRGTWVAFEGPSEPLERRCHFLHVALLVVPFTVAWYRRLGVPVEIAWASLADVARHMAIHRRVHDSTGVDADWWVTLCLRGEIVDLGRLQFNRFKVGDFEHAPLWYDAEESARRGPGFEVGDPCVGIHIPEGTPLSPEAVEGSLAEAGRFFETYFPVPGRRVATCFSWLLDDQLAEYLPAASNIVAFQRRFELVPGWFDGDADVLEFVFRAKPGVDLDQLPQDSSMERAAIAHLRAGRHWRMRAGWLDLPRA